MKAMFIKCFTNRAHPHISTPPENHQPSSQHGFTLLEVLISITLFMIITGAVYGLLEVARADRFTASQRVQTMQNSRIAMNQMGDDAFNAGYGYPRRRGRVPEGTLNSVLGVPDDPDTEADLVTPVVPGISLNVNNLNPDASYRTDQVSFLCVDESFNKGNPVTATVANYDANARSQIAIAAPTTTEPPLESGEWFNPNEIFLLRGTRGNALGKATAITGTKPTGTTVQFAGGGTLDINKTKAANANVIGNYTMTDGNPDDGIPPEVAGVGDTASISRVRWVTYKVKPDGTFVRVVHGHTADASTETDIAYGVERFDIEYVLTVNGIVTDNPVNGVDADGDGVTENHVEDICQIRVTLVARSEQIDKNTRQPHRITLNTTFNTRNIGYDAQ